MSCARNFIILMFMFISTIFSIGAEASSSGDFASLLNGGTLIVEESNYNPADTEPSSELKGFLDRLGPFLLQNSGLVIEIGGHTDNTGGASLNKTISRQRAEKARSYLRSIFSLPANRLQVKGYGSAQPRDDNATEAGRRRNRRIEIRSVKVFEAPGRLTWLQRDVLSKRAYEEQFVKALMNQGLYNLDRVLTRKESLANVTFLDKSEIRLVPESLLIMQTRTTEQEVSNDVENIQLVTGGLRTRLNAMKGSLQVKTPSCTVSADSVEIVVGIDEKNVSGVSVFDGSSKVSADGNDVEVPEGFGTTVAQGEPPAPPEPLPVAPNLGSPLQETFMAARDSSDIALTFTWSSDYAESLVELASDGNFSEVVLQERVKDHSLSVHVKPGSWFWRVSSYSESGLIGFAASSSFSVLPYSIPPELPLTVDGATTRPLQTCEKIQSISGSSVAGARISVPGDSAEVGTDDRFTVTTELTRGTNRIVVIGEHPDYQPGSVEVPFIYYDFWDSNPTAAFRSVYFPTGNYQGNIGLQVGRSIPLGPHGQGEWSIGIAGLSWDTPSGSYTRQATAFPLSGELHLLIRKSIRTPYLILGLTAYPTILRIHETDETGTSSGGARTVHHMFVSPEIGCGFAFLDWTIPLKFQVSYSLMMKDEPLIEETRGGISFSVKAVL